MKKDIEKLNATLERCFIAHNFMGDEVNITDILMDILSYLGKINRNIERLGLGDAVSEFGAIELLAKEVKKIGDFIEDEAIIRQNNSL